MPNWLNEALFRRYDEVSELAERLEEVVEAKKKLAVIAGDLISTLPEERHELMRAWQDAFDQQSAIQQQWSYITGVRDGVELITSLLALEPVACFNGHTTRENVASDKTS